MGEIQGDIALKFLKLPPFYVEIPYSDFVFTFILMTKHSFKKNETVDDI